MAENPVKVIYDLLKEISYIFNNNIRQYFSKWNLTTPQILVLALLDANKEMKISDIASSMSLADSNVSGIIDRLEKLGLAERVRSTEDRRIVKVRLADKSYEIKKDFDLTLQEYFSQLLKKSTNQELNEIIKHLEKLKELLQS